MYKRLKLLYMTLVILVLALFASSCGTTTDGKCSVDKDCARGFVCENGTCTVRKCESIADCNAGQVCVLIGDENVCTAQECTVAEDCKDASKICENGLCVPKPQQEVLADVIEVLEDVEVFEEIDETTDEDVIPPSTLCQPCTKKEDCGPGNFCSMFGGGNFCLTPCNNKGDCPSGYMCYPVTTEGNQCVPISYSCKDCAQNGCEPGKYCNFITGECIVPKALCEKCQYDFECGLNSRCYKAKPGDQYGLCVPECVKTACPDQVNFTCTDDGTGYNLVKLCTPVGGKCGDCPIDKPHKLNGKCVQCLNSTHCTPPATCDMNTHTCTSPECSGATPYKCPDGKCHQCCEDAHCKGIGEEKCDLTTYTCKGGPVDPCGGICADPYPACVVINGNPTCVQCDGKTYKCTPPCTCNTQIYYCEHPQGLSCVGTQPKCNSDADCPPNETYPNLKCHAKKFCYDPGGGCDNVSAFCDEASGSTCYDILSSLLGGGLPIPGGQGLPGLGYCTCNPGTCPEPTLPCTPMSFICLILPALCAGSTPPNICGDLLGGLFGGGGLPF